MWSEPHRAHPAGVIVYSSKFIGVLAAPLFIAFSLVSSGDDVRVLASGVLVFAGIILGTVGAIGLAWAEWYRFTFQIKDRTLRVEHGLIVRKSTRLSPERIQSVDTRANLLFRILGLVTVDVHTAGRGQAPEVSIPALTEQDARSLIAEIKAVSPSPDPAVAVRVEGEASPSNHEESSQEQQIGPVWTPTTGDIFLVGATSSAGVIAFAAVMPVVFALVPIVVGESAVARSFPAGSTVFFMLLAVAFLVMALFSWAAGTVSSVLMYWDFVTARRGDEIRVERGLLQRETRSVPLARIQAVRLIEGPLRQMLGRVSVAVDAAGIAAASAQQVGPTILHPLLRRPEARRFVELMTPGHRIARLSPLPPQARRRYIIRTAAFPLVVALATSFAVPLGWLALILPIAAGAWGLFVYSDAAWGVVSDALAIRYRQVARTTVLVRRQRIQSVAVSQHPLQRIAGLGTLVVRVASSPQPATFRLPHMAYEDALGVLAWVGGGVDRATPEPSETL